MLMSGQVYPLDISLENLKDRLGIPADKYKDKNGKDRIDHFEERVLKPAKDVYMRQVPGCLLRKCVLFKFGTPECNLFVPS